MATFITAYGTKPIFTTPVGSDEKPEFGYVKEMVADNVDSGKKVGEHEEIVFKQTGSSSISEYINSFNDTTDIKKIFARYQMGDVSVLSKRVGEFIDSVGCPETLLDAQLAMKNGDKVFSELPASVREKFDSDPLKFVQACQDGTIAQYLEAYDITLNNAVDSGHETYKELQESNKKIEELQAQIAELKGVKYE